MAEQLDPNSSIEQQDEATLQECEAEADAETGTIADRRRNPRPRRYLALVERYSTNDADACWIETARQADLADRLRDPDIKRVKSIIYGVQREFRIEQTVTFL